MAERIDNEGDDGGVDAVSHTSLSINTMVVIIINHGAAPK
jgi:hypothetical protein